MLGRRSRCLVVVGGVAAIFAVAGPPAHAHKIGPECTIVTASLRPSPSVHLNPRIEYCTLYPHG